jgi:hypothetical protein
MPTRITDKDEIIRLAEEYLKTNSRLDILSFIRNDMGYHDSPDTFITDVAYKMERTGKYEVVRENFPVYLDIKALPVKEKTWGETHPIKYEVLKALITAVFSLLVGYILYLLANQKQDQLDNQQTLRIQQISDSIRMLHNTVEDLKDTSKAH